MHNLARKTIPSIQSFVEQTLINLPATTCKRSCEENKDQVKHGKRTKCLHQQQSNYWDSKTFLAASQFTSLILIGAPRRTTLSTSPAAQNSKKCTNFKHTNQYQFIRYNDNYSPLLPVSAKIWRHLKITLAPSEKPTSVTGLKISQAIKNEFDNLQTQSNTMEFSVIQFMFIFIVQRYKIKIKITSTCALAILSAAPLPAVFQPYQIYKYRGGN